MSTEAKPDRLDQYVVRQLPSLSRAFADKLIDQSRVLVNGQPQLKSGYRLRANDQIEIQYDENEQTSIEDIELPIIYEDKSCVVIDKPSGLLSHSKGAFNPEATVASWLGSRVDGLTGERAGIVHRLDRGTSGVMIGAKTPEALGWLQKQFSQRKVKKMYLAVVRGQLKQAEAIIDMPIERNPKKPQTFRVGSNGKPAVTAYKVLKSNAKFSLLELRPTSGRTHQLRVHLSHLGHPILGDNLYGGQPADRLYLHASSLEITLPNKQRQTFESPEPAEFHEVVA
ncbi:MAG TPA: RluA family pseudouridine synthase [Candidatus Saccharimonadales bacterium]|jgi:23S rRNA pseudouridine1911/1915/1917 synthase|nr:RluA family pseudouridine synthase [Candidatus Saccharimonadales bacterium]